MLGGEIILRGGAITGGGARGCRGGAIAGGAAQSQGGRRNRRVGGAITGEAQSQGGAITGGAQSQWGRDPLRPPRRLSSRIIYCTGVSGVEIICTQGGALAGGCPLTGGRALAGGGRNPRGGGAGQPWPPIYCAIYVN